MTANNPATLDLSQTKDAHIDERLRGEPIVWLSSVRPDGRPHTVPVWFLWDGATVLIFSQPNQKIRNLATHPAVTLALDNSGQGSDVVLLEGTAVVGKTADEAAAFPAYGAKYATLMQPMHWTVEVMTAQYSESIRITPTRFLHL
ncbi:MAG: pyridoxamine 5'-phosphate oxidase family protein [Chloroflexota bacterium]|nr:pyridoxamine 5'-phosphate oxidase family protein [Chloroflexota bacterium]